MINLGLSPCQKPVYAITAGFRGITFYRSLLTTFSSDGRTAIYCWTPPPVLPDFNQLYGDSTIIPLYGGLDADI